MNVRSAVLEKIKQSKMKYYAPLLMLASQTVMGQTTEASVKDSISTQHEQPIKDDCFAMFREAEQEAWALLAFTEDCSLQSYNCGIRNTVGMGSTVDLNGKLIKRGTVLKNYAQARDLAQNHIEKYIYPQLLNFVKYERLETHQLAALISMFYNINPVSLTGYNEKMEKKKEPSRFIQSINDGLPLEQCAEYIPDYCFAGGKVASGLIKRRATEKWYFNKLINFEDILGARVCGVYLLKERDCGLRSLNSKGVRPTKDDAGTIQKFLNISRPKGKQKTVAELLRQMNVPTVKRVTMPPLEVKLPKVSLASQIPMAVKYAKIKIR